jgi:hypothetical protein
MMNFIRSIQFRISRGVSKNFDLILLWVLLIAIQPQISIEHILARPDLVPWLMFCLGCTVFLRGKRYGDGPHTSLTKRLSNYGAMYLKLGMIGTLIALVFWFDLGKGWEIVRSGSIESIKLIGLPVASSVVSLVLIYLGRGHEQTSWNPKGIPSSLLWLFGSGSIVALAFGIGRLEKLQPEIPTEALLLGLGFLSVGLVVGRVQHLRQRFAAGTKDGRSYRPALFNYIFSTFGAALGLWALYFIQEQIGLGEKVSFEQAFVPAAFVVAWAGVVWSKPVPIAVTCLLHEIMPSGGGDKIVSTTASPFDQTPEGALRINPLQIKRILATHPWLVPVKASRVPELDDPIRPLWPRREPPISYHVLGNASFEPCKYTNQEQWDEITIRLKGSDDIGSLSGAASMNRSIVVMKPFLRPGTPRKKRITTYRWENPVLQASIQNVDATTETLSLENGSVIVMATEGVARAFELEIGSPVYRLTEASGFRPPQIEDYVKV